MKKILTLVFIVSYMATQAQEKIATLIDRVNNTDYIFEGKVVKSVGYFNQAGNIIYTSNLVQITKIFKGTDLQCGTVEVITNGGTVGDMTSSFSHYISLEEGETGVFLCSHDEKETPSPAIFTPDNPMPLTMIYERQSLISYSYEGYDLKAYDVTTAFNDLQQVYTDLQALTNLTYIDCGAQLPTPPQPIPAAYHPDAMPIYTHAEYNRQKDKMEYAKIHRNRPKSTRAAQTLDYTMSNPRITGTNPQYFEFDINLSDANAGGSRYFASAYARLVYDPAVFGDSVAANGKIAATNGTLADTNCYFVINPNDE